MPSDREIIKLIDQFKSTNPDDIENARQELIAIGRKTIFHLIIAIHDEETPNDEIMKTIAGMSEENAIYGYTMIMKHWDDMPPEIVTEAQLMLPAFGIDPQSVIREKKEPNCVEALELELDAKCTYCELDLEHAASGGRCWLAVEVRLYNDDKQLESHRFQGIAKEAVEAFIQELHTQGFSKSRSRTMREWVYLTFKRD